MSTTKRATSASLAAEKDSPQPPADAPTLRPVASLSRRRRADFFAPLKNVPIGDDGTVEVEGGAFAQGAAGFAMLASIEECLGTLAIDRMAYDDWAEGASDADLMALFSYVFSQMSPGEAPASLT